MKIPLVVSYGIGVDSTALLIGLHERGIQPDLVLSADTGGERTVTYSYLPIINRWLESVGFPRVTIVRYEVRDYRGKVPYTTLEQECLTNGGLPSEAFGFASCSIKWKQKAQHRFIKTWAPAIGCWKEGGRVRKAIGFDCSPKEWKRTYKADKSNDSQYENWYPLQEWGWTRERCVEEIEKQRLAGFDPSCLDGKTLNHIEAEGVPVKSSCFFCLAGEEEVLTPTGARPISELVGTAKLLIPKPRCGYGTWRDTTIRSYGKQPLLQLDLRRGRSKKTVYATSGHRWVIRDPKNLCWKKWKTTRDLIPGDHLPSCRALSVKASRNPVLPSPFGIAHGFTFGDGGMLGGRLSPASVTLYGKKDKSLLRFFSLCRSKPVQTGSGKTARHIYDLPRTWKGFPSLYESKGYLLGWLAGYFAADGSVNQTGAALLYSARRENIEMVRTVCSLLGVQTGPPCSKSRIGFGVARRLYSISIYPRDLPDDFWLIPMHRARIMRARKYYRTDFIRFRDWIVMSVRKTGRQEEVFCATVPGMEMFTLADGLITGNCPNQKPAEIRTMSESELKRIVVMEARAKPNLRKILGLWRNGCKGTRGGEKKPGRMTDFILEEGLLPRDEVERLEREAPIEIVKRNEAHAKGLKIESWEEFFLRIL